MADRAGEQTAAVVLAAGESSRLGRPKLLLPFGESTVIGCVVGAMEGPGVHPILVVAGAAAPEIQAALAGTRAQVLLNPAPERGMVSSLRIGLGALPDKGGRFLIALGDQPRLKASDVTRLLDEQARLGKGIAIASYRGKRGHPVVFTSRYREEILTLRDDQILRDLIHSHADDVTVVECESDGVIHDIDTQEDYERELGRTNP